MPGIASMFDIGKKSLFANQAAIEVVGNNISNANTPGYSRQAVRLEDGNYISYAPGQLGTGVNAVEVIRAIIKAKPSSCKGVYLKSCCMSSTMGPGFKMDPVAAVATKTR